MQRITIKRARTWHCRRMRHYVELSNGLAPSSQFRSWLDCIINTSGCNFRKGQAKKQAALDDLAEDISFAIHDLLNCAPTPTTQDEIAKWKSDFEAWCDRVSKKLENRAFFTRADQLHFDRLGFIDPLFLTGQATLDRYLAQLRLKLDRLREVINWAQQRRR